MPMLITGRGVVFLEGASEQAPPGELIGPAQAPKTGAPGEPGADPQDGQDGDQGDGEDEQGQGGGPAAKAAERAALGKWLAKHPKPSRPFACKALTAADVPDLAADPRVLLKAGDGRPKALSGTGPAGSGTRSW